ncbi:hypothetical protein BUALT_Bualt01G0122900 [Buddleja alternifolia]|uniref:RING-type E3 ubiquitin transferase n=1 Tax=Buddleja alternifolia TaxID=168488 RepID=A0AAV6Y6J0_9LAMI|nr:hypothetical protein BUALT_Bualt01G0122900 [Buddleja alternifolia]
MNTTSDESEASDTNIFGGHAIGGFGYGLGLSLGVLIIFVIIAYISYTCKRHCGGTTTLNHRSSDDDSSIVTIHHNGLDEATLSSYPHFTYSQLKPHKTDSTASGCSICLADYKDTDLLRLLPDCGHIFHLNCIDPWLILHPTCPICRFATL